MKSLPDSKLLMAVIAILVVALGVVGYIAFKGDSLEWRAFYVPHNPATLEGGLQWPIVESDRESQREREQEQRFRDQWDLQGQQERRFEDRIRELERRQEGFPRNGRHQLDGW